MPWTKKDLAQERERISRLLSSSVLAGLVTIDRHILEAYYKRAQADAAISSEMGISRERVRARRLAALSAALLTAAVEMEQHVSPRGVFVAAREIAINSRTQLAELIGRRVAEFHARAGGAAR